MFTFPPLPPCHPATLPPTMEYTHAVFADSRNTDNTPPALTRALAALYPYLLLADRLLDVLAWTGPNPYTGVLAIAAYVSALLYWERLATCLGHLILLGLLFLLAALHPKLHVQPPTPDDLITVISDVAAKTDFLLAPCAQLAQLTRRDWRRFTLTTVILSPIYILTFHFLLTPRISLILLGSFILSYNSLYSRVARVLLWRSRTIRLLVFYLTGLDSLHPNHIESSISITESQLQSPDNKKTLLNELSNPLAIIEPIDKRVTITHVIFENQRKWLGIGWTDNLLPYERESWTDEYCNPSESIENFKLPIIPNSNIQWKWIDENWFLDLSNNGNLTLKSKSSLFTMDPKDDDGWIYYNNNWGNSFKTDSFSRHTRRRRWVRVAELVAVNIITGTTATDNNINTSSVIHVDSTLRKRLIKQT